MSKSPPRKKLKQASILDSFKREKSERSGDNTGATLKSSSRPAPEGQEAMADDGGKKQLPKAAEDGGKKQLPKAAEDGGKKQLPKAAEDGGKKQLPKAAEDGGKKQLPKAAEDGGKKPRSKTAEAAEKRLQSKSPYFTPSDQTSKHTENFVDLTDDVEGQPEVKPSCSKMSPGDGKKPPLTKSDTQTSDTLEYDNHSPDMFTDEEDQALVEQAVLAESTSIGCHKKDSNPWRGIPKEQLKSKPACAQTLPALKPDPKHILLFRPYIRDSDPPRPYPETYKDTWDANHVKMPCSSENLYPIEAKNGKKELKQRWNLIKESLEGRITNSLDLEEAILSYNTRFMQRWDFRGLHSFFMDILDRDEAETFFSMILPKIIKLALQLPEICTKAVPLLKRQKPCSVSLTQQQVACLLANAFFCTFPRRNSRQKQSEYSSFPEINFNQLFQGTKNGVNQRKAEKLKCLVNYFRRVTTKMPTGVITFTRQHVAHPPSWDKSSHPLPRLHVTAEGTIEEDGTGMLQVDFANKFLGGGVLGYGCVQEEIRFLICPEMIVSRLFTEVLDPNECLIMTGCEQFSSYSGYGDTFRWAGNYVDETPRDSWGRRFTEVVAIDAIHFRAYIDQFKPGLVKRELNKAYCGFCCPDVDSKYLSAVATGNWGCGAFLGDLRLKALIQLMAAGEAKRDVCYFTFGDWELKEEIYKLHCFIKEKDLRMSDLWALIQQFYSSECQSVKKPKKNLFQFIYKVYSDYNSDTDEEKGPSQDIQESDSQEVMSNWEAEYDGKVGQKPEPDWRAATP